MYAIIEESGSQRKVQKGDEFLIDLWREGEASVGASMFFEKVLVVGTLGGSTKVGAPYVANAKVSAEVVEPMVKGDKVHIQKFREKKTWKKKTGHRQRYTRVKVIEIAG
jgi:large subunit ribosomal protein L21